MKEEKRQTAREKVNPGGKAIEAAGDACLAAIGGARREMTRRAVPEGMTAAEIEH